MESALVLDTNVVKQGDESPRSLPRRPHARLVEGGDERLRGVPGANGRIAFEESTGTTGASFDIFAIDPNGANRVS